MENINPQTQRYKAMMMLNQQQAPSQSSKKHPNNTTNNNNTNMNSFNLTPQQQQYMMMMMMDHQQQQQSMSHHQPSNPNGSLLQQQQNYMMAANMMNQQQQYPPINNTNGTSTNSTGFSTISNLVPQSTTNQAIVVQSVSGSGKLSSTNNNSNSLMKSHSTSELSILKPISSSNTSTNNSVNSNTNNNNSTTRVKVVVRVRPTVAEDVANSQIFGEYPPCVEVQKTMKKANIVKLKREHYDDREFSFDRVLDPNCTQDEMYKEVGQNIVNDVLKGYNGTILAYGQTGSGKTFTIFGNTDSKKLKNENTITTNSILDTNSGVIPRCVNQIFQHVHQHSNTTEFRVVVSFMQLYMESIMDLLDSTKTNLPIREDPKNGVFVEQLSQVQVNEPQEVMQLIREGSKNRQVNSTNMNKLSSRSHVMLMITVEQKNRSTTQQSNSSSGETESIGNSGSGASVVDSKSVKRGVLYIVDLAGSERVFKSGSEGQRLEEAKKINKSLSALGNCVAALTSGPSVDGSGNSSNNQHVPFRDSKLTRLLTDSLGGNAKTCLVATVGPSMWNYDESHSTLHFASRAMKVKNHAIINEVVDFKVLSGNLQKKITVIENEKTRLMERNVDLEREISKLRSEISSLSSNGSRSSNGNGSRGLNSSNNSSNGSTWEDRERELIDKFGNVIRHLQMEIAKQNILFNRKIKQQEEKQVMNNTTASDEALERVIDGLLSVQNVKQRIIAKLVEQGEVREINPWTSDSGDYSQQEVEDNYKNSRNSSVLSSSSTRSKVNNYSQQFNHPLQQQQFGADDVVNSILRENQSQFEDDGSGGDYHHYSSSSCEENDEDGDNYCYEE